MSGQPADGYPLAGARAPAPRPSPTEPGHAGAEAPAHGDALSDLPMETGAGGGYSAQPGAVSVAAARSILHHRDFLKLWLAQAISLTVQNSVWFALWILVEERTHSSTQISIAIITSVLPSVLLGPVSGVIIDRMNKRDVLLVTTLLRIPAMLGFLLYDVSLALLYGVNLLFNAIGQFFVPAEGAKIPLIVARAQLITANSLFNITFTLSQLLGLVIIGPALFKLLGPDAAFVLAAATFVVCSALIWALPRAEPPVPSLGALRRERVLGEIWREVIEGWRFVTQDRQTSLAMAHLTVIAVLTLVMPALAPRFAVSVLDIGAADAVWVLAPAGVGLFAGTSFVPALVRQRGKARVVQLGLLTMAVFLVFLGGVRGIADFLAGTLLRGAAEGVHPYIGVIPIVMGTTFILGAAMALISVPAQTVLMERAPDEKRGRVLSTQFTISNLISTAVLLGIGGLADILGLTPVLCLIAAGVLALWFITRQLAVEPARAA